MSHRGRIDVVALVLIGAAAWLALAGGPYARDVGPPDGALVACVVSMIVVDSKSASRWATSWNSRRACESNPTVGSSRNSSSGRRYQPMRTFPGPPFTAAPAAALIMTLGRETAQPGHVS